MPIENPSGERHEAIAQPFVRETPPQTAPAIDLFDAQTLKQRHVIDILQRGVEGILTSAGYQAYLRTMAKFHHYSFANSLLIYAQKPVATRVAGYRAWQSLGRQVRKGETGIKIFVPFTKRLDDPETGEEDKRVTGFGVGNVFDVSSTDGEPLPERPAIDVLHDQIIEAIGWINTDAQTMALGLDRFGDVYSAPGRADLEAAVRAEFKL